MRKHRPFLVLVLFGLLMGGIAFILSNRPAVQAQDLFQPEGVQQIQMSSTNFDLSWDVIGTGGGVITSDHFRVHATIGQPTTGWKTSTNFQQHTGYWQSFGFTYNLYLPLIIRD